VYFFCFFVVIECTIFICACMYFMYFIFLCLEIFYVVKFCWMVVVTLCSTLHISVCKQEVWPPDSADMVCPRPPLMRQIQHFVSRIKNRQRWDVQAMWAYELDLWPWGSPRLSVIHVFVLCQSTKCQFWWYSDYLFSICGPLGQHCMEVMAPVADAGRHPPSVYQVEVCRPCYSEDMAHDVWQH